MTRRKCFALDLVNDAALIQEYCRLHEPGSVWPTIIEHIRAQGVEAMEIWQRGDRLFMIIDAAEDYPRVTPSRVAQQERDKWEAYMATFQRALPDAAVHEKWAPLRCVFQLSLHERLKP